MTDTITRAYLLAIALAIGAGIALDYNHKTTAAALLFSCIACGIGETIRITDHGMNKGKDRHD